MTSDTFNSTQGICIYPSTHLPIYCHLSIHIFIIHFQVYSLYLESAKNLHKIIMLCVICMVVMLSMQSVISPVTMCECPHVPPPPGHLWSPVSPVPNTDHQYQEGHSPPRTLSQVTHRVTTFTQ